MVGTVSEVNSIHNGDRAKSNEVFLYNLTLEGGCIHVSDSSGLGVDFTEDAAVKYPYYRTYLPVSRLEDGTLWSW